MEAVLIYFYKPKNKERAGRDGQVMTGTKDGETSTKIGLFWTLVAPALLLSLLCMLLEGCATSLPNVPALTEAAGGAKPEIVGPEGKLSPRRAGTLLTREAEAADAENLIKKTVALMESLSGRPLTSGNKITLLVDGPATYEAMFKAIEAAKDHVNFETFTFSDDEVGRRFVDLLMRKQGEGVQVNLMYDSVGSFGTPPDFFARLRDAGINVLEFNPVNPLKVRKKLLTTQRDHRKVVVVDGRIGFTGGVNISDVYSGSPSGPSGSPFSSGGSAGTSKLGWRDTHVMMEGPVVAELQRSFLKAWEYQKGPPLAARDYFPHLDARGKALAEVIVSYSGDTDRLTYVTYVAAIENAKYWIDLTTAYFVPDHQLIKAITDAAKRGVEVRIVVPSASDSTLALYAGRFHYGDLLESGVRVYERRTRMIHAKTVVIDGVWSTVGSTNMDLWSFLRNDEINVVVIDTDFANELEKLFGEDLTRSNGITPEEWSKRPISSRLKEFFSVLLSHWL
jgi:cardiolipin synthase